MTLNHTVIFYLHFTDCIAVASISVSHAYAVINGKQQVVKLVENMKKKNHSCTLSYTLAYLMHVALIIMQQGRDSYPTFLSCQLRSTIQDKSRFSYIFSFFGKRIRRKDGNVKM